MPRIVDPDTLPLSTEAHEFIHWAEKYMEEYDKKLEEYDKKLEKIVEELREENHGW